MSFTDQLLSRSNQQCELCQASTSLQVYEVPPIIKQDERHALMLCQNCLDQIEKKSPLDAAHWQALPQVMWSETPALQIMSWRMLQRLKNESWAADALDQLYLDDDMLERAKEAGDHLDSANDMHLDAFGNILQNGDSVVLTKSLDVKGSSVNAKVGTVVKNIKLVPDNHEQIEGRIDNQLIVILTKYLKKSS